MMFRKDSTCLLQHLTLTFRRLSWIWLLNGRVLGDDGGQCFFHVHGTALILRLGLWLRRMTQFRLSSNVGKPGVLRKNTNFSSMTLSWLPTWMKSTAKMQGSFCLLRWLPAFCTHMEMPWRPVHAAVAALDLLKGHSRKAACVEHLLLRLSLELQDFFIHRKSASFWVYHAVSTLEILLVTVSLFLDWSAHPFRWSGSMVISGSTMPRQVDGTFPILPNGWTTTGMSSFARVFPFLGHLLMDFSRTSPSWTSMATHFTLSVLMHSPSHSCWRQSASTYLGMKLVASLCLAIVCHLQLWWTVPPHPTHLRSLLVTLNAPSLWVLWWSQLCTRQITMWQCFNLVNFFSKLFAVRALSATFFGADFRVWKSMRLFTLDSAIWPPSANRLFGNGASPSSLGLHDGHIWYALSQAFQGQGFDQTLLIHPRLAFGLLAGHWTEDDLLVLDFNPFQHGSICCVFESRGHWALLWGKSLGDAVLWTYLDGIPGLTEAAAGLLAGKLTHILGFDYSEIIFSHDIRQNDLHTCGTIAILHAFQQAGLFGSPTDEQVRHLHSWLLDLPLAGIVHGGGLSTALQDKLKQLLIQHGVPAITADERQLQVVQKLGPAAIHETFAAKNPWAYLKALCSKPSINLRLVHADELTKHVAATATSKFGAGVANHKQKKKSDKKGATSSTPSLDPAMLVLSQNGFKDSEDDVVPQISFDEVTAGAHGIAISNFHQSYQILQTMKSISSAPLGLLLVEPPPAEFMDQFKISSMTFTATYKGTGEPVLIFGAFKSLGDQKISLHIPGNTHKPELIATQVIKVQVFRDEFEGSWAALAASPVKVLCQTVPLLTLCHGQSCGSECPKSHAAIDEHLDTILMEVWSRTFTKIDGGRAAAQDSTLFWVFFRIPQSIVKNLLQIQAPGIYFEPRDDQTKSHDEHYRVIWLPSKNRDQALHVAKTCLHSLGLVRMRMKFGIRVAAEDEEAAFKIIKPDSTFVATQVQRIFQLFPLPHGLQRAGVSKLLEDLEWTIKPLQPGKGNSSGMSWTVGSDSAPPRSVITGFGKEILITEITKEARPNPPPRFIASQKTQKHLKTDKTPATAATSSADPWLNGPDPWNSWKSYSPVEPAPGKTHLKELQGQLRDELQANLQKEVADLKGHVATKPDADTHNRMQQMETTIGEIQAQGQQFQAWFHTMGQQMKANESVVQTMQSTLNLHQQELHGIKQDLGNIPAQVSQTVQGALQAQRTETDANMEERFNRLETLLTGKLQRREWLSRRGNLGPTSGFLTSLFRASAWLQLWIILFFGFMPTCSAWSQPFAVHYVPSTASSGDCDLPSGALGSKNMFLALVTREHFEKTTRIGEAAHPGPTDGITLGCTNPGGLRSKEDLIVEQGQGVWTYSETQLSAFTQRSAAKALRASARAVGRVLRPHFGAPAPLRSRSSWAGSWTGVACLSDFPSKSLAIDWPPDLWTSGRVLATQHFIGPSILTVISLYGLPRGPTWPAAASMMAEILEFISKTFVFGHSGLVAIQGDYNFGPHELDHFHLWRSLGWTDAQSLAIERWGHEWQPTCKGSTERDMIWMSPALAALCTGFQIRDVFADHSSVSVTLAIADEKVQYWTWPKPRAIPWDQVDVTTWHQHCENLQFEEVGDSTAFMVNFGHSFETSLQGFVKDGASLHAAQCGRAQTLKPRLIEQTPITAKASRQGEIRLTSDLVGRAVQLWFKQARRLQSLVHSVRAGKTCLNAVAYRLEVWSAVLQAKGFDKPFLPGGWIKNMHLLLALCLNPLLRLNLRKRSFKLFMNLSRSLSVGISIRKGSRFHRNMIEPSKRSLLTWGIVVLTRSTVFGPVMNFVWLLSDLVHAWLFLIVLHQSNLRPAGFAVVVNCHLQPSWMNWWHSQIGLISKLVMFWFNIVTPVLMLTLMKLWSLFGNLAGRKLRISMPLTGFGSQILLRLLCLLLILSWKISNLMNGFVQFAVCQTELPLGLMVFPNSTCSICLLFIWSCSFSCFMTLKLDVAPGLDNGWKAWC